MADYEEGELDEEPPSGRDRVLSSPASPRQNRRGPTHGAGVGAAKEGPEYATGFEPRRYGSQSSAIISRLWKLTRFNHSDVFYLFSASL